MIPLPRGPFDVISADIPWPFLDRLPGGGRGAEKHYDLMTINEIKDMGPHVQEIAADDSHLYLWVPNAFVRDAWDVAWDWGFKPKCLITWVKSHGVQLNGLKIDIEDGYLGDDKKPSLQMGMGWNFRGVTEQVVFATRGRKRLSRKNIPTVFFAPRGEHSSKPSVFYNLVKEWSPGRGLDMFARKNRENWEVWGDEVPPNQEDEVQTETGVAHHTNAVKDVEQIEKGYDG